MYNSIQMPSMHPFQDMSPQTLSDLDLTFQGHPRSTLIVSFESPYMISYTCTIIYSIQMPSMQSSQDMSPQTLSDLNLTFQGHPRSNLIVSFQSPYMIS